MRHSTSTAYRLGITRTTPPGEKPARSMEAAVDRLHDYLGFRVPRSLVRLAPLSGDLADGTRWEATRAEVTVWAAADLRRGSRALADWQAGNREDLR